MDTKVLILSLGKGRKMQEEDPQQDFPYTTAKYRVGNSTEFISSPFVAEALINEVKPDHILVIGTVKSAWGAFYRKYHDEELELSGFLKEIEKESLGKDSSLDEINAYEESVNELFQKEVKIDGNPKLDICMIQYGMNDTELNNSYRRIREALSRILSNYVQNDIEISIDMTHSFRSLPIYNLVVLDYCRLLISQKIRIGHVYYGNLDVKSENNDIAQIVDLKNIINILDTTKGINEFLHTGNANTFLENNEEMEDPFINALRDFNGAMQMNNRWKLQTSLKKLLQIKLEGDPGTLFDAKTTIQNILLKEFSVVGDSRNNSKEGQKKLAKFQLHLASWCLRHGNVGIASAIAKEGFRSFLVAVFEQDVQRYENEKARQRAEQMFENCVNDGVDNKLLSQYKTIEKDAREIRNTFAHNLNRNNEESLEYADAIAAIEKYINNLREIMECYEKDDSRLRRIDNSQPVSGENKKITFYITESAPSDSQKRKLTGKDTDAYYLQIQMKSLLSKDDVKRLSSIIAYRCEELLECYDQKLQCKVVWSSDIYKKCVDLIHNAIPLIKSYCDLPGLQAYILKARGNSKGNNQTASYIEEQYVPIIMWKVDFSSVLNDENKENLKAILGKYKLVRIYETE